VKLRRNRERISVRGLSDNYNRDLKNLFKSTAISASTRPGPFRDFYLALLAKGMRPTMARLTLARKIAAITLTIWKKGVDFDAKQLDQQAAIAALPESHGLRPESRSGPVRESL
jgi:hypothetical protein